MNPAGSPVLEQADLRASLAAYLLALADDELILGHRHSEWTGLAPDIESDVALSSVAQEELGHARLFYERACDLRGGTPDTLAYGRSAGEFRNAVLVERPNGDWAFTIVRMFLYDRADAVRLEALAAGPVAPLAQLAAALRREEKYHLLYGEQWLRRLAGATPESRGRVQKALEAAWPGAEALFEPVEGQDVLTAAGVMAIGSEDQRRRWRAQVTPVLESAGLRVPAHPGEHRPEPNGRAGGHTADLQLLLEEMTSVWRSEPGVRW
ncbi:MAG: 1,2-phenylacetyl-CoA epoxidase subunit PaaC [Armatimonadota bacterium]|nr:1,2-phenylacetyl-CoA epoxidase subunit PaaC [Armatimonadota bacterium]